jgi:glutaredoxin
MKNKVAIPTILFIIVLILSFVIFWKESENGKNINGNGNTENQNEITLFYGEGCPHCKIVDEYIEENKIKEKISFDEKEVYNNKINLEELREKAKFCGLSTESIGVPLLFDGKNCFIGDKEIINFWEEKINEK